MTCGIMVQRVGDLLLLGRREDSAVFRHLVNKKESVASMIAPANARPNESPKLPRRGVHPGCLTDALLRDRRKREIVELRYKHAQSRARNDQRDRRSKPESARGTTRIKINMPMVSSAKPALYNDAGSSLSGLLSGQQCDGEHAQ